MNKSMNFMKMTTLKKKKPCFSREPIREHQKKPLALPLKTAQICFRAMPTL